MSKQEIVTSIDSIEDKVLAFLKLHNRWEAVRAAEWIQAFNTIECAYAEYTGGYIGADDMLKVLSEQCFNLSNAVIDGRADK